MTNSGFQPYLDLTTSAKQAGGVDALIGEIQKAAVWKTGPKILVVGLVAGAAVVKVTEVVQKRRAAAQRRSRRAQEALRDA